MQNIKSVIILKSLNLSRQKKLKIKNLNYFDFDYENKRNEFIVNVKCYIYYYNMFI